MSIMFNLYCRFKISLIDLNMVLFDIIFISCIFVFIILLDDIVTFYGRYLRFKDIVVHDTLILVIAQAWLKPDVAQPNSKV